MTEIIPQVSIVIPTYNRHALVRRSISSAITQEDVLIEVIVIDDGSDPPIEIEKSSIVMLIRTENRGVSSARNIGLERASGDYVLFLDSDDWLEQGAVANLLAVATRCRADLVYGHSRYVNSCSREHFVVVPKRRFNDSLANAVQAEWPIGSFIIKRMSAARFDESITLWEVLIFQCESLACGKSAAYYEGVVVNINQHDDPTRISNQHDHFEPLMTARTFLRIKLELVKRGLLTEERIISLDRWLLMLLMKLVRARRLEKFEICKNLHRDFIPRQASYRFGSFAWCVYWAGIVGADAFVIINKMLRR